MNLVDYDIEVAKNWIAIGYWVWGEEKEKKIDSKFSPDKFLSFLKHLIENQNKYILVGYNNKNYDSIILDAWLTMFDYGERNINLFIKKAFELNKILIGGKKEPFEIRKENHITPFSSLYMKQIDLMNFNIGIEKKSISLKEWAIKLHVEKLNPTPKWLISGENLTNDQIKLALDYLTDDMIATHILSQHLKPNISVLHDLIQDGNLSNKNYLKTIGSIVGELFTGTNRVDELDARVYNDLKYYNYEFPFKNYQWKNKEFAEIVKQYENYDFNQKNNNLKNKPRIPFSQTIEIGGLEIEFGEGGIHAFSKTPKFYEKIKESDVNSKYPNLIVTRNYWPRNMNQREDFKNAIVEKDLVKKTNPRKAQKLKVKNNTVYGLTLSPWNPLYDRKNNLNITITGQLFMTILFDQFLNAGIKVIALNTDSINYVYKKEEEKIINDIFEKWTKLTQLKLGHALFEKIWYRDINNYVAILENGKIKTKGTYNIIPNNKRNANMRISIKAVIDFLVKNIPIEETILNSKDIRDFVLYHKIQKKSYESVKIGNSLTDHIVRYYFSNKSKDKLEKRKWATEKNLNPKWEKLANNDGIVLLPELKEIPKDLDYEKYIEEAFKILEELTGKIINNDFYNNKEKIKLISKITGINENKLIGEING